MNKVLFVIDMQVDFVIGALANNEAQTIIPAIAKTVEQYKKDGLPVFFTRDTHGTDYMDTQEGKLLPVPHCVKGTEGWQIVDALRQYAAEEDIFDKPSFGAINFPEWIMGKLGGVPEEIELCGVCTDICVIANGILLKVAFPETKITVSAKLCAGVTPESHQNALNAMRACQIIIEN